MWPVVWSIKDRKKVLVFWIGLGHDISHYSAKCIQLVRNPPDKRTILLGIPWIWNLNKIFVTFHFSSSSLCFVSTLSFVYFHILLLLFNKRHLASHTAQNYQAQKYIAFLKSWPIFISDWWYNLRLLILDSFEHWYRIWRLDIFARCDHGMLLIMTSSRYDDVTIFLRIVSIVFFLPLLYSLYLSSVFCVTLLNEKIISGSPTLLLKSVQKTKVLLCLSEQYYILLHTFIIIIITILFLFPPFLKVSFSSLSIFSFIAIINLCLVRS